MRKEETRVKIIEEKSDFKQKQNHIKPLGGARWLNTESSIHPHWCLLRHLSSKRVNF